MNCVQLVGYVGNDAVVKTFNNGNKVTNFSIATNDGFGDRQKTTWHFIKIFGNYGETISKYITKGKMVSLSGSIDNTDYEKDGVKRIISSIIVDKITILNGKDFDTVPNSGASPSRRETPKPTPAKRVMDDVNDDIGDDMEDDDLPF